jgi:hypothetical protein
MQNNKQKTNISVGLYVRLLELRKLTKYTVITTTRNFYGVYYNVTTDFYDIAPFSIINFKQNKMLLITWGRVLLENVRFITMFTWAINLFKSRSKWIHFTFSYPPYSFKTLPSNTFQLTPRFTSGFPLSVFQLIFYTHFLPNISMVVKDV